MNQTYLLPKALNTATGQTVKTQDLTGARFTTRQRALAQDVADRLAENLSARTRQTWVGFLEEYQPTSRG